MIRVGPCGDRLVYLAIRIGSCRVLFRVIRVVHFRLAPFGGKARHKGNETYTKDHPARTETNRRMTPSIPTMTTTHPPSTASPSSQPNNDEDPSTILRKDQRDHR